MRRTASRWLAAISLLAAAAHGATRPRYGGTLRIEIQQAVQAIEPAAGDHLAALVFEPLVRMDPAGRPQPALALSWQREAAGRRWQFKLRPGVRFHDGSPLTPASVAASLTGLEVAAAPDSITVRSDRPLALDDFTGRLISLRAQDGTLSGTGPFRPAQFEPGRRAVFNANEDYWEGRPFLDAVAVEMGRAPHDQMLDLELGKADLIELWPNELRRAAQAGIKTWFSAPVLLIALVFERVPDAALREAIALSLDRTAIRDVLLQKQGEVAGGLLPQWISGYAFLFPALREAARARQLATPPPPPLLLGYDPADPLARPLAERIALNAREAGIRLQPAPQNGRTDLRLARVRIRGVTPDAALESMAPSLGLGDLAAQGGIEAVYASERAAIDEFKIVPIVHLPVMYASRPTLRAWQTPGMLRTGEWCFDDLWLGPEHP